MNDAIDVRHVTIDANDEDCAPNCIYTLEAIVAEMCHTMGDGPVEGVLMLLITAAHMSLELGLERGEVMRKVTHDMLDEAYHVAEYMMRTVN